MDELQRYVDILFADYRNYEPARRLRLAMLDELLLEKERLQMSGKSEKEAVQTVLASLDDFGAPAEGNRLIYISRFRRDSTQSLLLWLLAGMILSAPLLMLSQLLLTLLLFAAMVAVLLLWQKAGRLAQRGEVGFWDMDLLTRQKHKLWRYWCVFTVLWAIGATLFSMESFPLYVPIEYGGFYGSALKAARYYPPIVLAVIPLWGNHRFSLMLKNEVGAEGE